VVHPGSGYKVLCAQADLAGLESRDGAALFSLARGQWQSITLNASVNCLNEPVEENFLRRSITTAMLFGSSSPKGIIRHRAGLVMGIVLFVAPATTLRGELKVDRVMPSTRAYVHVHAGCIGNLVSKISINAMTFSGPSKCSCLAPQVDANRTEPKTCIAAQSASAGLVVRLETAYFTIARDLTGR
jgi:hypothetical protein